MIKFDNVTKVYKNGYVANQNISFSVEKGDIVGLVGPNGAGKTTLIRQLFHLLETTEGSITVDGKTDYMDLISYVPQIPVIFPALTVCESIDVVMRYQGLEKETRKKRIKDVVAQLEMSEIKDKYVYTLSEGQKKLLEFASAIVMDKEYMILDEVTSMVDIVTKERIWRVINSIRKDKGIVLASHDMAEVKNNCNRLVVLKDGKVIFYGGVNEISGEFCKCKLMAEDTAAAVAYIKEQGIFYEVQEENIQVTTNSLDEMMQLINNLTGVTKVCSFECEHPAFYEGVIKIVKEN